MDDDAVVVGDDVPPVFPVFNRKIAAPALCCIRTEDSIFSSCSPE